MTLGEFLQDEQGGWSSARLIGVVATLAGAIVGVAAAFSAQVHPPDGFFSFLSTAVGGGAFAAGLPRAAQYFQKPGPAGPADPLGRDPDAGEEPTP